MDSPSVEAVARRRRLGTILGASAVGVCAWVAMYFMAWQQARLDPKVKMPSYTDHPAAVNGTTAHTSPLGFAREEAIMGIIAVSVLVNGAVAVLFWLGWDPEPSSRLVLPGNLSSERIRLRPIPPVLRYQGRPYVEAADRRRKPKTPYFQILSPIVEQPPVTRTPSPMALGPQR